MVSNVVPNHYSLYFEPNLDTFVFNAKMEFQFELEQAATSMQLHALELNINSIKLIDGDQENEVKSFELDLEDQHLIINFDEELSGEQTLVIEYTGEHNDKLAGWYRGKFTNEAGEEKYCVVSQFQANDARRAFPCVDIPGKKATFDVSFLVPDKELMAISNTPIVEEEEDGQKKLVTFDTTPKMSTYLLFFGVGDFEAIEKTSKNRQYRTIAHPPKAEKYGQFSLDFGIEVVEYLEQYFDFDYPLPKLDQIATPAFAAGAMENWGAILYRENALLYYPDITSQAQENSILSVIAHEITHQWFGNLVSPQTWKSLWLNESFATFFATHTVDHLRPNRNIFDYYVASTTLGRRSRSTSGVMDWDSMIKTSPIELEGDGEISFTAKTVPILYSKGGSILRQVKAYLGDDGFRDGLRAYFKKHAYGASQSDYLWTALKEATGKPVNKMMETWILQEGLPLVTVQRDGSTITLSQERFTYLPYESDNQWIVPVTIKLFKNGELIDNQVLELTEKQQSFELKEFDAYKLNSEMTGFFRTKYPEEDYAMLKDLVQFKQITAIDRLVLEDELFALLKATKIGVDHYLDFIEAYTEEDSHLSLFSIAVHLRDIYQLLEGDKQEEMATRAKAFMETVLDKIGYGPKEDESMGISIIRGTLLNIAVEFDSDKAEKFALEEFEKVKNGVKISADLRASIKRVGAKLTNDYEWFRDQFDNPESESEFISTISAMTNFSDEELLEKVQNMVFTDIPSRNRGLAISSLCRNPVTSPAMWEYYIANLDSFEALNNFMYQGAVVSTILTGMEQFDDIQSFFDEYLKKNPQTSDAVDVGLEQLKIQMQFKEFLNQ